jgi:transposase InsO family protein
VSASLAAELTLDALEMVIWRRRGQAWRDWCTTLTAGSNTWPSATPNAAPKRASRPQSGLGATAYDNALAETVDGLYKTELMGCRGPWRTLGMTSLATAAWVDWWNRQRLHSATDHLPSAGYEAPYYRQRAAPEAA